MLQLLQLFCQVAASHTTFRWMLLLYMYVCTCACVCYDKGSAYVCTFIRLQYLQAPMVLCIYTSMYACMCVCMYVCVCAHEVYTPQYSQAPNCTLHVCLCMYTWSIYTTVLAGAKLHFACMCVCMYVCTHEVYTLQYSSAKLYFAWMYVCMYVRVCVCTYVHMKYIHCDTGRRQTAIAFNKKIKQSFICVCFCRKCPSSASHNTNQKQAPAHQKQKHQHVLLLWCRNLSLLFTPRTLR